MANEDIDYGQITEALNDKADRDLINVTNTASVPYHIAVESNLQEQIDALSAKGDIADIVGTYADLTNYDKTKLSNNDIIQVLQDSTHDNATSYYKYVSSSNNFTYVGSTAATYTKTEADNRYVHLNGNENIDGSKTFIGTFHKKGNYTVGTLPSANQYTALNLSDSSGTDFGSVTQEYKTDGSLSTYIGARKQDGSSSYNILGVGYDANSLPMTYTFTPSATNSTSDTNIANVGWVNDPTKSTNVVHRTGNETITGEKTFANNINSKASWAVGTAPSSTQYSRINLKDSSNTVFGQLQLVYDTAGSLETDLVVRKQDASSTYAHIKVGFNSSGNAYTYAPTPTDTTTTSGTQIATTGWVNGTTNNLVHKSGDETIAGAKTFNSADIKIKSTSIQWSTPPDSGSRYSGIIIYDKDGKRIGKIEQYQNSNGDIGLGLNVSGYDSSNNIKYSTPITTWIAKDGSSSWTSAPTPASGDNSTKIATTAWVNNSKATISKWAAPNFSSTVSVSALPFTAPYDCYVFICAERNANSSDSGYIQVNGKNVLPFNSVAGDMVGDVTTQFMIAQGDKIQVSGNAKLKSGFYCKPKGA